MKSRGWCQIATILSYLCMERQSNYYVILKKIVQAGYFHILVQKFSEKQI